MTYLIESGLVQGLVSKRLGDIRDKVLLNSFLELSERALQVFLVRVDLLQEINLADFLLQVTQARYFVSNTTVKTTPTTERGR